MTLSSDDWTSDGFQAEGRAISRKITHQQAQRVYLVETQVGKYRVDAVARKQKQTEKKQRVGF